MSGEERLRAAIRRFAPRADPREEPVDDRPGCTYGLLTRDAVDDLRADIEDVKREMEWIRRVIVVAIVSAGIGTLLRMAGWVQWTQ